MSEAPTTAGADGEGAGAPSSDPVSSPAPSGGTGAAELLPEPAPFRLSRAAPRPRPARPRAGPAEPPPRVWESVGFRLASILAVALLPLGLVAVVQSGGWLAAVGEQRAAVLAALTQRAAGREAETVAEARGLVAALAQTVPALIGDEAACDAAMTALRAEIPAASLVAFVPVDGQMRCASDGKAFDFAGEDNFQAVIAARAPLAFVSPVGPVSRIAVVGVTAPVRGAGGAYLGFAHISLRHAALALPPSVEVVPGMPAPDLVALGPGGTVLSASPGNAGAGDGAARAALLLPRGRDPAALAAGPNAFTAEDGAGIRRHYAVVPLGATGAEAPPIVAVGSVPVADGVVLGGVPIALPLLIVLAMWAASLAVAGWAAHRLVTRPMRGLAHAIRAFAGGARVVDRLETAGAPGEVREVAQAFGRMTDIILHDEAELEDGLRQREALLREIHHRTKNNLQLMASIINMQVRRTRSDEARALMRGLQERVLSLATVHRDLFQTARLDRVPADQLLRDVARQAVESRGAAVTLDLAPLGLGPDQAVPLALLVTEALTGLLSDGAQRLRVGLTIQGGEARLAVSAEDTETGENGLAGSLGEQLIQAFASQLGGRVESEAPLVVRFPTDG